MNECFHSVNAVTRQQCVQSRCIRSVTSRRYNRCGDGDAEVVLRVGEGMGYRLVRVEVDNIRGIREEYYLAKTGKMG